MKNHRKHVSAALAAAAALAGIIPAGCGRNCADAAKLGDFEYSQNNHENASRHYRRALEIDPGCGGGSVAERLKEIEAASAKPRP